MFKYQNIQESFNIIILKFDQWSPIVSFKIDISWFIQFLDYTMTLRCILSGKFRKDGFEKKW